MTGRAGGHKKILPLGSMVVTSKTRSAGRAIIASRSLSDSARRREREREVKMKASSPKGLRKGMAPRSLADDGPLEEEPEMRKLDLGQAEEPEAGPEPESGAAEPETEPETEPELEVGALKTDVADSKKRTQGALLTGLRSGKLEEAVAKMEDDVAAEEAAAEPEPELSDVPVTDEVLDGSELMSMDGEPAGEKDVAAATGPTAEQKGDLKPAATGPEAVADEAPEEVLDEAPEEEAKAKPEEAEAEPEAEPVPEAEAEAEPEPEAPKTDVAASKKKTRGALLGGLRSGKLEVAVANMEDDVAAEEAGAEPEPEPEPELEPELEEATEEELTEAAMRIQSVRRGKAGRREVEAKRNEREATTAALQIQSVQRGKAARREVEAKRQIQREARQMEQEQEQRASKRASTDSAAAVAIDETVILLHPPPPLVGVSIVMERGRQANDCLADG